MLFRSPDGKWRMWYNNERDHKSIYFADSDDLNDWNDRGKAVGDQPGEGPNLHKHPYSGTWIVRGGKGRFTADSEDIDAGPGDILVVGSETPHKFKNVGTERLDVICIHASPRIIQEALE